MLFFLFVVSLVAAHPSFLDFVNKYEKVYDNEELLHRLGVYMKNIEKIDSMNANEIETVYAVGPFADLEEEEFNAMYTGWNGELPEMETYEPANVTANTIDWRAKNAVTPVKDQGKCGSCWAFSATEGVESNAFVSGKYKLEHLSCQQVTACDKGSSGCGGGWPGSAFDYLKKAGGIETEADYPYTAGGGSTGSCKFDKSKVSVVITGYKTASKGEDSMLKALQSNPLSICHQTGGWQHYASGSIMTTCGSGGGHCTQLIGYTEDKDYWVIKNSWATRWGTEGYIYIKKGSNLCGIANSPMHPTF